MGFPPKLGVTAGRPFFNHPDYDFYSILARLMLPYLDNLPTFLSQELPGFLVSLDVSFNLGHPKSLIRFWTLKVLATPMPETAVYENCDFRTSKDDICPPIQILFRFGIYTITKPRRM